MARTCLRREQSLSIPVGWSTKGVGHAFSSHTYHSRQHDPSINWNGPGSGSGRRFRWAGRHGHVSRFWRPSRQRWFSRWSGRWRAPSRPRHRQFGYRRHPAFSTCLGLGADAHGAGRRSWSCRTGAQFNNRAGKTCGRRHFNQDGSCETLQHGCQRNRWNYDLRRYSGKEMIRSYSLPYLAGPSDCLAAIRHSVRPARSASTQPVQF
jgi:hypothetical protein